MTKVSVREFRQHLVAYLKKLPVLITNWDKPVAIVYTPQEDPYKEVNLLKDYIKELEQQLANHKTNVYTASEEEDLPKLVEIGRCGKCFKTGKVKEMSVPSWDTTLGENVDTIMKLCQRCQTNLSNSHL